MSTNYYYPKRPITKIEIQEYDHGSISRRLSLYIGWMLAYEIIVYKKDDLSNILLMLADHDMEIPGSPPMHTYFGGADRGCAVEERAKGLDPEYNLISSDGELMSVRDIRALEGQGRVTPAEARRLLERQGDKGSQG